MENYAIIINQIFGLVWSYCMAVWLFMGGNVMDLTIETVLVAVIPAVISSAGTFFATRRTQLKQNTEALSALTRRLGVNDEQTLSCKMESQYHNISNDIGRREGASLTMQHQAIEQSIERSFAEIKNRYDEEDKGYRRFTQQQYDIKKTMDNFIKDYAETIGKCGRLENTVAELEERIEELENENARLRLENDDLKRRIAKGFHMNVDEVQEEDSEWEI